MQSREQRVLQSLRRVQSWCAANPELVAAPEGPSTAWSPLTRQLDVINTIVAELTDAAAIQSVKTQQATLGATSEDTLRKQLRIEMHAITQVGQALRKMVPGIGTLKMPSPKLEAEALLKAADALKRLASTYETVLVEHGLAPDFLAQLGSAIDTLKSSVDGRGAARAKRVSATRSVKVNLSLGHRYVSILDAALSKTLLNDPAKLAEWKHAKRVTVKGVLPSGTPVANTIVSSPVVPIVAPVTQLQVAPAGNSTSATQAA